MFQTISVMLVVSQTVARKIIISMYLLMWILKFLAFFFFLIKPCQHQIHILNYPKISPPMKVLGTCVTRKTLQCLTRTSYKTSTENVLRKHIICAHFLYSFSRDTNSNLGIICSVQSS